MGVPTVVVTTEQFRRLTDQVAKSLNRPDLRIVETRHPIGGVDEETARAWADEIAARAGARPIGLRPLRRSAALIPQPDRTGAADWPLFGALTLARGVCDGLWVAERFANRECAEELDEILQLVTGPVEASARQRMTLAGLLVGAHHRAVRHEDAHVSKALLTLLHAWAVREEATREEREVLAHGLGLALEHARARGDQGLASKIETALAQLPTDPPRRGGAALAELAAGS